MTPLHAALYWRFLYEQCGEMGDTAAGMSVIRRALRALYAGDVVDVRSSSDLVENMPGILDRALKGASCPFQTHGESLTAFARAIYALRLEDGRCTGPGVPAGCGFYDPGQLYHIPPAGTITYEGERITFGAVEQSDLLAFKRPPQGGTDDEKPEVAADRQPYPPGIRSSFGMDFVEVKLDPAAEGGSLTLEFFGAPGAAAKFNVQLWKLLDSGGEAKPRRIPSQLLAPEVLSQTNADGHLVYTIDEIDTTDYNTLGLIITRIDPDERADPVGAYTIVLRPT